MTMTNRHTPGPWRTGTSAFTAYIRIENADGVAVAELDRSTGNAAGNDNRETLAADARLIAAAPALLAAVKVAHARIAAVAKATGLTPGVLPVQLAQAIAMAEGADDE